MKKLITILVLVAFVACVATAAMAQNNPIQKGSKALSGFVGNWNSMKPDKGDTMTNYRLGGAFEYFLSDQGALRLGVNFGQTDMGGGTKDSDSFISIGYKYNFRQADAATFPYLRASYGFGNEKYETGATQWFPAQSISVDTNGFDVALGLEHLIGNAAIFGEIDYMPLTRKYNYANFSENNNATVFGLNLGLKFYF